MKCDWCPPKNFSKFPGCFKLNSGSTEKKNPGSVRNLHALARGVMPTFFDGLELDYRYRLAANKVILCDWLLSHIRPSGFRFGGIYSFSANDDMLQTPTIKADINPTTLASNVSITYFPLKCLRFEADMQRAGEESQLLTHVITELVRPSTVMSFNAYNFSRETGRFTLAFMRSVSDHWALGAELLLEWTEPNIVMADTAAAARYSHYNYSVAASASRQGVDVSYWHRIHKRIQFGSLFGWRRKTEKTIGILCYQWDFKDAMVRAMFDSEMSVGFMYFRTLSHIPCGVGLSFLMRLPTNRFIFGLKFSLDPSGYRRGE